MTAWIFAVFLKQNIQWIIQEIAVPGTGGIGGGGGDVPYSFQTLVPYGTHSGPPPPHLPPKEIWVDSPELDFCFNTFTSKLTPSDEVNPWPIDRCGEGARKIGMT